jgi:hypothetical protein
MNQTISQAHDLWLGDARILCLQLLGNAAGRLTDDLKQASQDQVENSLAIQVLALLAPNEGDRFAGMF